MEPTSRQCVRIAERIRDQLKNLPRDRRRQARGRCETLTARCAQLETARRQLARCEARGWDRAAGRLIGRIAAVLRDLPFYTEDLRRAVDRAGPQLPALRTIYGELQQARDEFGAIRWSEPDGRLSAVTEPIELEGVYLGPFEIALYLADLGAERRFDAALAVVALDPNPAASNAAVTHPHVTDERLCAGDAGAPIAAALSEGRICDAFCVVRSVLKTYNPESPYVALSDWQGAPCYDCGIVAPSDEVLFCRFCEHDFCPDCASFCRRCDESACFGCLEACPVCGEPVCPGCMRLCDDCGRRLCATCLDERQCPCLEDQENQEPNEEHSHDQEERQDEHQRQSREGPIATPSPAGPTSR